MPYYNGPDFLYKYRTQLESTYNTVCSLSGEFTQNWNLPVSADPVTDFYISSAIPESIYIDLTSNMNIYFDRSQFLDDAAVWGILYIKTNTYDLSGANSIEGFSSLGDMISSEYNGIIYFSPPYSNKASVR